MVMIRKKGKAQKIAENVMKQKGVQQPKASQKDDIILQTPYLQH
jgi:hypothetical protein